MPPADSKSFVVQAMEASTFDGRYTDLRCVNYDLTTGVKKEGFFSLVFHATDQITGGEVAIKVMDPDLSHEPYRIAAFQREPTIIASLVGQSRALQLIDGHNIAGISISLSGYPTFSYRLGYFVTEWLEDSVEDFFFNQDTYTALSKLRIFREILLAIMACHQRGICHRDLKLDNLRLKHAPDRDCVVAIDFGTAARLESPSLGGGVYAHPVGYLGYAPPEAFCGLSGDRDLGSRGDVYAVGAMLFELFNTHFFYNVRDHFSPTFRIAVSAILAECLKATTIDAKKYVFTRLARATGHGISAPSVLGPHHTIPNSIVGIIEPLYNSMTHFDYSRRPSLELCLRRVDSCIRYLTHAAAERDARERRRRRKEKEIEAARRSEDRIRARRQRYSLSSIVT